MALQDIGSNIRRYMKIQHLSIPRLAQSCGLGVATVSNLLNGKNSPNTSTLLKISTALDVPLQKLVVDAPQLRDFRFRTQKTMSAREKAEQQEMLTDSARWLKDYNELEELTNDTIRFRLKGDYAHLTPEEAAKKVRGELGVTGKEPIADIVNLIENAGVKVRISSFGFKQTFGISVGKGDGGPAIFVNSYPGISIERQIFTVAHELGHILMHLASYDENCGDEDKKEEAAADSFASFFLMPGEAFAEKWEEFKGSSWLDTVLRMKRYFNVSYKTVLMRYCAIHPRHSMGDLSSRFASLYKQEYGHDLKDHYEPNAIDDLAFAKSNRFNLLVRKAYETGVISFSRAVEILDITTEKMRDIVATWTI
jgi:Zn-dependent peptidase ImmA (M78 family)/DNA-binding Xre family transcriptional regulator